MVILKLWSSAPITHGITISWAWGIIGSRLVSTSMCSRVQYVTRNCYSSGVQHGTEEGNFLYQKHKGNCGHRG